LAGLETLQPAEAAADNLPEEQPTASEEEDILAALSAAEAEEKAGETPAMQFEDFITSEAQPPQRKITCATLPGSSSRQRTRNRRMKMLRRNLLKEPGSANSISARCLASPRSPWSLPNPSNRPRRNPS
jgi:hypothetical protein